MRFQLGGKYVRTAPEEREAWRLEERRMEVRYTLILRAGVIEQQHRSSFCLVKNISNAGVQVKLYAPLEVETDVTLRVADEPPLGGRVAWMQDRTAGIHFHEELDPTALLRVQQKLRPNRKRSMPRMNVVASAILRTRGRTLRAIVRDISSLGARIETDTILSAGDRAIVEFADLPSIEAFVRWSDGREAGLVFQTPIPMQIIAHWIESRMNLSDSQAVR